MRVWICILRQILSTGSEVGYVEISAMALTLQVVYGEESHRCLRASTTRHYRRHSATVEDQNVLNHIIPEAKLLHLVLGGRVMQYFAVFIMVEVCITLP